jgi:hypothetical protein
MDRKKRVAISQQYTVSLMHECDYSIPDFSQASL